MMPSMPQTYVYLNIDFYQPEKRAKPGKFPKINAISEIGIYRVENKKLFHFFNSSENHIAFTHNGIVLTETYFIAFAASILYS
jgi:hypothetical protein